MVWNKWLDTVSYNLCLLFDPKETKHNIGAIQYAREYVVSHLKNRMRELIINTQIQPKLTQITFDTQVKTAF